MLNKSKVQTAIPTADLDRAKAFYGETLGMPVLFETPGGVMYGAADGTRFVVFPSPNPNRGGHTQMSWDVKDVVAEVAELKKRGIVFEEYDFPTLKTVDSVAQMSAGKAAWFKDPDGNMLGLFEFA